MRVQANQAIHYGHGFGFGAHGATFIPEDAIDQAKRVVTNQGRTTVRRQIFEAAVFLAFVSELVVVFVAMGW